MVAAFGNYDAFREDDLPIFPGRIVLFTFLIEGLAVEHSF